MELESLPSHVLLLLALTQLGDVKLRRVLADAISANAGTDACKTRAAHVAAALVDQAAGREAITRLATLLSIATPADTQLVHKLQEGLSRALEVGDHDRADAIRDALKDATDGRLFWQSTAKGLLTGRLAPSLIALPISPATR